VNSDVYLRFLQGLRLFEACTTRELRTVARSCTVVKRAGGSVLVREGAASREFLSVASGSAVVTREGLPDVVIGPGEWFGDADLLSGGVSSATVTTLTEVELIVMSWSEFSALMDTVAPFRRRVVKALAACARSPVATRRESLAAV